MRYNWKTTAIFKSKVYLNFIAKTNLLSRFVNSKENLKNKLDGKKPISNNMIH